MERWTFFGAPRGLTAALAAGAPPTGQIPRIRTVRSTSFESMARRLGIAVMGLVAFGCVGRQNEPAQPFWLGALPLLLSAAVVFLLCIGLLVLVSSRRRRRKLAKILVALVAGSVCGAIWILLVDIVFHGAIPEAMNGPAEFLVGVATGAIVAVSLLSPRPSR